jgi:hypothetical protein
MIDKTSDTIDRDRQKMKASMPCACLPHSLARRWSGRLIMNMLPLFPLFNDQRVSSSFRSLREIDE